MVRKRHCTLGEGPRWQQQNKARLTSPTIVVSPGVYNGHRSGLAEQPWFKAASMTGAGLSNSRLGQPDIGILSLTENVEACRWIARSISIPHTVQFFDGTGVLGISIEDRERVDGPAVQDRPDMLASIEEIIDLTGYSLIDQFEAEFRLFEDLEQKCGGGQRSFFVRS